MSPPSTSALPQLPSKQKMMEQGFPGTSPGQQCQRRHVTQPDWWQQMLSPHILPLAQSQSALKHGVLLVAYDTSQPPLPGLPLWQSLTHNDYSGCLFVGVTAGCQGRAPGHRWSSYQQTSALEKGSAQWIREIWQHSAACKSLWMSLRKETKTH